jgi:hypothetical protein
MLSLAYFLNLMILLNPVSIKFHILVVLQYPFVSTYQVVVYS